MSSERRNPGVGTPWNTIEPRPEQSRVTIRLSRQTISTMDALTQQGVYASIAELVREGVRHLLTTRVDACCSLEDKTQRRTVRLPGALLAGIDAFVADSGYANRSAVVRAGIHCVLDQYTPSARRSA